MNEENRGYTAEIGKALGPFVENALAETLRDLGNRTTVASMDAGIIDSTAHEIRGRVWDDVKRTLKSIFFEEGSPTDFILNVGYSIDDDSIVKDYVSEQESRSNYVEVFGR